MDHDPGLQSELGDETARPSGLVGRTKDESHPVLADRAAGTSPNACAWTHRPTREESSLVGDTGECAAANYGAGLHAVRVANTDV